MSNGLTLPFSQSSNTDVDLFTIRNQLQLAQSDANIASLSAVVGHSDIAHGVHGISGQGGGTAPQNPTDTGNGTGVWGESSLGYGVFGASSGNKAVGFLGGPDRVYNQHAGVYGESDQQGVFGNSTADTGTGVYGIAHGGAGFGVRGDSSAGTAVQGQSFGSGDGVHGISANGTGIHGTGGANAALFDGHVQVNGDQNVNGTQTVNGAQYVLGNQDVTGTLTVAVDIVLRGADCAEEFDLASHVAADPGTVMVFDRQGAVKSSESPYDKRVAGVVSGAGNYRPGLILDGAGAPDQRVAVALVGKVFCKVDAQYAAIEIGDLLTTSPTAGHAMKAVDPTLAFGAVLGKALGCMDTGHGLIPILAVLR